MWAEVTDFELVRTACLEVMRASSAVYVTTLDASGAPCTRAMFNLRRVQHFPDLAGLFEERFDGTLTVVLSTNTSSEKVRQLERDPRVTLYYCLPEAFHGVMLSGRVAVSEDLLLKRRIWQKGWEIYFPHGVGDPDFTLLMLCPERARGWLSDRSFDLALTSEGGR